MLTSPDFLELLNTLAKHGVKYLVVGGYAVMKYAEPRFTKDLDLFIAADPDNAKRVFEALSEYGAPLTGLKISDFEKEGFFYQMGRPPLRVDVLMSIDGVDFSDAWTRRVVTQVADSNINFISKADLIRSKRASGRPQDLIDVENLEAGLWTEDDLRIVDPIEHIQRNPTMYLGKRTIQQALTQGLSQEAQLLGAKETDFFEQDGWWFVRADIDWLICECQHSCSIDNLFWKICSFPEGGENAMRCEVVATAFASAVITYNSAEKTIIKGDVEPNSTAWDTLDHETWQRVVAFTLT